MKRILSELNRAKLEMLVNKKLIKNTRNNQELHALERRYLSNEKRKAEIVKGSAEVKVSSVETTSENLQEVLYICHYKWLNKQKDSLYLEERMDHRKAIFYHDELIDDQLIENFNTEEEPHSLLSEEIDHDFRAKEGFSYDRLAAVQYAERWWNDENPKFKNFDVNCTNFVSQCLHAGNAKMRGYPNRSNGWWMQNNNWSFSWSVANAMTSFLKNSKIGLRAKRVEDAEQLKPGDVICYDFQGDGRFDHTTFVVAKDPENMPLVNAQTYNSRMRYWAYEDSSAYTPNIKYAFFRILDDTSSK
ncbi:rubrerythrin [Metabacillus crassostreae]|uniref:amidase domain-containing protein n=1 Tax=Metabacillus crassostreae TaxID=929098 RepID=UPI001EF91D5B|nr:amidase domain-containing protein [Metabacillus crassostreae]MBM7604349.1 rubrerythrin [Metabacillus crassostreae]